MRRTRLIGCRVHQFSLNVLARFLPWRKAERIEGAGSVERIPELLRVCGARKPLVVTGPTLLKKGIAARVTETLAKARIPFSVFSQVEADPSDDTVETIFAQYRSDRCDSFIALGGGSPMDAAKAAAARATRPGTPLLRLKGILRVLLPVPPFIAVPTTAGTGSDTSIAAVISDPLTHKKSAIADLRLIPRFSVLDPDLTAGLPPSLIAYTGMDALTHAVEGYLCWTMSTKESRACAAEAVRDIFRYLETAYAGGSPEARAKMLSASYQAGWAFTRAGVGNVHAIAHTVGALYGTQHGLANAVLLPIVLSDYGSKVYKKLAYLSEITGTSGAGAAADRAAAFIRAIEEMNARMGIPRKLDCIRSEDIPKMAVWAAKEANPLYPVPVCYDTERFEKVIGLAKQN